MKFIAVVLAGILLSSCAHDEDFALALGLIAGAALAEAIDDERDDRRRHRRHERWRERERGDHYDHRRDRRDGYARRSH